MELVLCFAHVVLSGFSSSGSGCEVGINRFLPQSKPDKNMRRHVKRVRGIWSDFGVAACCFQSLRRKLGGIRRVNEIVDRAGVLRLGGGEPVQDGDYLLANFGVVGARGQGQKR